MAVAKVIYKSSANATPETWMDATTATATAEDITAPKTAMLADGVMTEGTGSGVSSGYSATMTGSGADVYCYIEIDGTKYYSAGILSYSGGESATICGRTIIIDGVTVVSSQGDIASTYTWTLPNDNISSITFSFSYDMFLTATVTITTSDGASVLNKIINRTISGTYENDLVKRIGTLAFASCTSLTSVNFSNCTTIEGSAFYHCTQLTTASFPVCTSIGSGAFSYCTSLTTISFPLCTSINMNAFNSCTSLRNADFSLCTWIGNYAFERCIALSSISFPLCTSIGNSAFNICNSLTTASFPSCTLIGSYAFASCTSLTTITFPLCTSIGIGAFQSCKSLTTISFPVCESIFGYAFSDCSALTVASFPSCTSIGNYAFQSCKSLTTISFPLCTSVGAGAFTRCWLLGDVYLPNCSSIGNSAFQYCEAMQTVSIPLLTSIPIAAFANCSRLISVNIPLTTGINSYAFSACTSLLSVKFLACQRVSMYGFYQAYNITKIILAHGSTATGGIFLQAFGQCYNLLSLYLLASTVYSLANVTAFTSTPISTYTTSTGGVNGSIFVRASLYDTYRASTNWVTYSDRFVSMTDAEIDAQFPYSVSASGGNDTEAPGRIYVNFNGIPISGKTYHLYFQYKHLLSGGVHYRTYFYEGNFVWNEANPITVQATDVAHTVNLYLYNNAFAFNFGDYYGTDLYEIEISAAT